MIQISAYATGKIFFWSVFIALGLKQEYHLCTAPCSGPKLKLWDISLNWIYRHIRYLYFCFHLPLHGIGSYEHFCVWVTFSHVDSQSAKRITLPLISILSFLLCLLLEPLTLTTVGLWTQNVISLCCICLREINGVSWFLYLERFSPSAFHFYNKSR